MKELPALVGSNELLVILIDKPTKQLPVGLKS